MHWLKRFVGGIVGRRMQQVEHRVARRLPPVTEDEGEVMANPDVGDREIPALGGDSALYEGIDRDVRRFRRSR